MTYEMMLARALSTPSQVMEKDASAEVVEDEGTAEAMEKLAWADEFGRELAREAMEKIAINPASALMPALKSVGKSGLGKAMQGAVSSGLGKRMAVGAAAGAVPGAIVGGLKNPGVDPATGQQRSRLGGAMAGAAGGAMLGAAGGAAAKRGAMALGSSNTRIGRIAGQSLKAEAGQSGNLAARQASKSMQVNRMGSQAAAIDNSSRGRLVGPMNRPPGANPLPAPAVQAPNLQPTFGKTLDQQRMGK